MHIVAATLAVISTVLSWLACRIRSRAELELELIALRHQVGGRYSEAQSRMKDAERILAHTESAVSSVLKMGEGGNNTTLLLRNAERRRRIT